MKIASFKAGPTATYGLVTNAGIIDAGKRLKDYPTLKTLLANGSLDTLKALQSERPDYAFAEIELLPTVPDPDKIFCIGVNYATHLAESGHPTPPHPMIFTRFANSQVGGGQPMKECRTAIVAASTFFPPWPYSGTHSQRGFLRDMTSFFVGKYIVGLKLRKPAKSTDARVEIAEDLKREMRMLQELTWHYVIKNPALATQQHGYRKVISDLFKALLAAIKEGNWALFPPGVFELIADTSDSAENVRIVADFIASMSEPQALELYQRLMGISIGSFLKTIH